MNDHRKHEPEKSVQDPLNKSSENGGSGHTALASFTQPVHTVYGGAHLFTSDVALRMGRRAIDGMQRTAPTFVHFARALQFPGSHSLPLNARSLALLGRQLAGREDQVRARNHPAWLAHAVYRRVLRKLERQPVEDYRVDFEDGYGYHTDAEEDSEAVRVGAELANGYLHQQLPPSVGIRTKGLGDETRERAIRTLSIVLHTIVEKTGGLIPEHFIVTLPKIHHLDQVSLLEDQVSLLERKCGLAAKSVNLELMIETPQSLIGSDGRLLLPALIEQAGGRCRSVHFGAFDFTASLGITLSHQGLLHPVCDVARTLMQIGLAGTDIAISDSVTTHMPVEPHRRRPGGRALTRKQMSENRTAVELAWRTHYNNIRHSLEYGLYQGWDLHPLQLPVRFAAVYLFFLEQLEETSLRLTSLLDRAARATLAGQLFDDAATGQGMLNFFLRGIRCGALDESDLAACGLSISELQTRSFSAILSQRAHDHTNISH